MKRINFSRKLNMNILPYIVQRYIKEYSETLNSPPEYILGGLLANISTVIGNSFQVKIKDGWYERANLYIVLVGSPASRKSPAINLTGIDLQEIQQESNFSYKLRVDKYKNELKKHNIASKKGEYSEEPGKPIRERVIINDATVEKICELLQQNPFGLLIEVDELSALIKGFNQYKSGGNDREFFLCTFDNKSYSVDRKSLDEALLINKPFLSILGGIQPDKLKNLLNDSKDPNDGFIERLLFIYPETTRRFEFPENVISYEMKERIRNLFFRLHDVRYWDEVQANPITITFGDKAFSLYKNIYVELEQLASDGFYPQGFEGVLIKMQKIVARLALILHLIRMFGDDDTLKPCENETEIKPKSTKELKDFDCINYGCNTYIIDEETMQMAIELVKFFIANALKVHCEILREKSFKGSILHLIKWLNNNKNGDNKVAVRDIAQVKTFGDTAKIRKSLAIIAEYGFGELVYNKSEISGIKVYVGVEE